MDEVESAETDPEPESRGLGGTEIGLLDDIEAGLAEIQGALERLDDATYGSCETCGSPIDDSTLERAPTARLCARHLPLEPSWLNPDPVKADPMPEVSEPRKEP